MNLLVLKKTPAAFQKELDEKAAAKGKKAKSLVKYFQYLDEVAKDLGISVEDNDENN